MLFTSSRLAVAGTLFVALGIACSLYLIVDVLYGSTAAAVVAAVTGGAFAWFWYGLPLLRRHGS